ncbi:MAG: DUF6795 domain-containing protein [Pseudomonadota bacterium]|uniref:DUF6795 domain-containing protein n=1 Tax=Limnobacter alexandrii TaxID=2570352 RepID=UPI001107FCFF|nr:DUF6795 domain-containing protein [Limnobacter alexandrii]
MLSSVISGQLSNHGVPLVGAKVVRVLYWNMDAEPRKEITFTDGNGVFLFPEVRSAAEFGLLAKLFHVPVISIDVELIEGQSSTSLFATGRNSYNQAVEHGYEKTNLSCDLKDRQMFEERLPIIDCKVEQTNHLGLFDSVDF